MRGALARPSLGLGILLTTLVALGPLSTDLYLPSLPTLARVFEAPAAQVQLTLSVFLVGYALGQLVYGALSDRFGRRPVMLWGLALYALASLGCLLATSMEMLIGARFVQALGACAGPVLGRTIVRDVWGGLEAMRVLAYVSGAMAIAPLLGPALGGWLTVDYGWQASFVLLLVFSTVQWLAVWHWLGESHPHPDASALAPRQMAMNLGRLFRDRAYMGYLLCQTFAYSALFVFISGSSFVLVGRHGLSPTVFGMAFGGVVLGYIVGNLLSARLVRTWGAERLIWRGGWLGAVAGLVMVALALAGVEGVAPVLLPTVFTAMALGFVMPNAVGRALAGYPDMAGVASALMGFCQMTIAALVGVWVGHGVEAQPQVLAWATASCSLMVPLSYRVLVGRVPAHL